VTESGCENGWLSIIKASGNRYLIILSTAVRVSRARSVRKLPAVPVRCRVRVQNVAPGPRTQNDTTDSVLS
jgi:hypothetical protein